MSDFDVMRERIEQCGRWSVEVAAPAVADERPGDGNGQSDFPFRATNQHAIGQMPSRASHRRAAANKKERETWNAGLMT